MRKMRAQDEWMPMEHDELLEKRMWVVWHHTGKMLTLLECRLVYTKSTIVHAIQSASPSRHVKPVIPP